MRGGVVAGGVVLMIIGLFFMSFLGTMWGSQTVGSGVIAGLFIPQLVGIGMLFLGFILLIAGLAASPIERPVQPRVSIQPAAIRRRSTPEEKTRILAICPKCKSRVRSSSKFCPECGVDLREQPADVVEKKEKKTSLAPLEKKRQPVSEMSQENIIYCIYCGQRLLDDAVFCSKCGKKAE